MWLIILGRSLLGGGPNGSSARKPVLGRDSNNSFAMINTLFHGDDYMDYVLIVDISIMYNVLCVCFMWKNICLSLKNMAPSTNCFFSRVK